MEPASHGPDHPDVQNSPRWMRCGVRGAVDGVGSEDHEGVGTAVAGAELELDVYCGEGYDAGDGA